MFVWVKGKIIKKINKAKERAKKSNIAVVNEKESNILSYDKFVNDTEQLNDLLQELEAKIESDKNELAQVKMEFDENKNKMEDLDINLENEENSNNWLAEEADLLEETKINIKERAERVPSHFTYDYCSKITKQLDASINDIKNFPNTHITNIKNLGLEINELGYVISDGDIKIKELQKKIATNETEQNEVSSVLESRNEFDSEKLKPLVDEHKKGNIIIDQIKLGRGPHADYSNEKQTLFNLQDKIEEEIKNYYNSDFSNFQSKFHKKNIRDTRRKNEEINTDFLSSKLYPYKAEIRTSAEWKDLETTNVESTRQSVQTKKENQEKNILKNCRHCQGYGCLRCNDTGYDGH